MGTGVVDGSAPRNRVLPSFRISVMTGLAAGLNLCSLEYLEVRISGKPWNEPKAIYSPTCIDDLRFGFVHLPPHVECQPK